MEDNGDADSRSKDDGSELIDPTAVVGRRMAGWLIDVAIVTGIVLIVLLLLGDSFERPGSDTDLELRRVGSDTAVFFRSTVAVVHAWEWAAAATVGMVSGLVLLIALPGRRGWTPGLLAAELRLVDGAGGRVGFRPALVRFVGWLIDILPGIPLVGLLAMRFGRHHQRIGDRMAHTYVVDRAFVGAPPTEPATRPDGPVAPVVTAEVAPDEEASSASAAAEETTVHRRLGRRRRQEAGPVAIADDTTDPADTPAPSATEPAADTGAWAAGTADRDDRSGPAAVGPPEGVVADQPQWDRAQNRYVMWHGATGRWVGYDDEAESWKPL